MTRKIGRGHAGERTVGGESNYKGCNLVHRLSFCNVGLRMFIVGPHAAAAINNKNNINTKPHRGGGGGHAPPPSGPSHPVGCHSSLLMLLAMVDSSSTRAFGAWSYTGWRMKVCAVVLICQVLIQPGVDIEGKRSGVGAVELSGRRCQAEDRGGGGTALRW
jgi:hypothetical protein